jgi:Ca-activated chloride channel family protein
LRFFEPGWLALLILAPLPWLWLRSRPRLAWPTLGGFANAPRAFAGIARHIPPLLRGLEIICLAVALARPQTVGGRTHIAGRGVAIVLVLDRSSSMKTEDFPDLGGRPIARLEAAKRTLARFVAGRPDDLIGLVAFANYPDLACPPTLDHEFLVATAEAMQPARAGEDGTNIGDAVAWALDALRKAPPKKKVLVLLTDGDNRPAVPDPLDPREAAHLARSLGVTLHAVALGRPGGVGRRRENLTGLELPGQDGGPDLALLGEMAAAGGGRMFVADDVTGLQAVFRDIDALERSPVQGTIRTRYREWYWVFVAAAVGLLVVDRLLCSGRLGRLP